MLTQRALKTVFAWTGYSASHRQNHKKSAPYFRKRRKFGTKWYVTLRILNQSMVRNRTSKLEFT